jgi:hypothetical protein
VDPVVKVLFFVLVINGALSSSAHRLSFAFLSAGPTPTKTKATKRKERPDTTTKESLLEDESSVEQDSILSDSEEDSDDSGEEDDDGNEDVSEELQEEMATMSVTARATIKLPMLTYTWSRNRQEYCSVDILLLSGTTQDQIECTLHKSGHHMTVFYKLPEFFVTSHCLKVSSQEV